MNAFGSPRAGCAFRLFGLALILSGSGCAVIVLQAPVDLQSLVYLAVAAVLLGGGFLFIWDTNRTEQAASERRKTFTPTSVYTANALRSQAKRIVNKMPDYNGDLSALRSSGWVDFPGSVIVTYERTLKQKHGTVPVCISIGFAADGTQHGPYYHLEPFYPQPGDY